ncbi:hypothetical protein L209DRAFT_85677 [Thermothelomyces heterothallicus CBS 203.75]
MCCPAVLDMPLRKFSPPRSHIWRASQSVLRQQRTTLTLEEKKWKHFWISFATAYQHRLWLSSRDGEIQFVIRAGCLSCLSLSFPISTFLPFPRARVVCQKVNSVKRA